MAGMSFAIALTDEQWELVADLFDPPGRRGAQAQIPRHQMVDAMLFIGRTGCQWRYLPERYGTWTAVWAQWRRWRSNGVWARAMERLAAVVRVLHDREPVPSMVMVDAQTVKGGRYGPTFHEAGGRGGRTIGTKRTLLVEILGLPLAARADSARPHDVVAARELLHDRLADLPRVRAIVGDRAYRGLAALADRKHLALDIKAPPPGTSGFTPLWPLYRIEHAFAGAGALAPPVALLRGHRGERPGLARGGLGWLPRLARDRLIAAYPPAPGPGLHSLGGSISALRGCPDPTLEPAC
jgi:transposase